MIVISNVDYFWLRNRSFDMIFLLLPLALGMLTVGLCTLEPALFPYLLLADLWLLGYHHVISTYTRIAFDWVSAKRHYFLVFVLPVLVVAATYGAYRLIGHWVIASVYLYWQWFHYTRQSYGISRYYLSRGGKTPATLYHPLHTAALWALPITGILYRSWQAPGTFLMMELKVIPISFVVVAVAMVASAALILWQLRQWYMLRKAGFMHGSYAVYMLSHHAMFLFGYILVDDINTGWLGVNIWHNLQYILFVWMQNNQKFKGGIVPNQKLVSGMSQDGRIIYYMVVCLGFTFGVYILFAIISQSLQVVSTVAVMLIVFMSVNFHHYVVDAVIWRRKKAPSR